MDGKHIVITGSTRGIGYGLADAFLARGCRVVINGRSPDSVTQACQALSRRHDAARVAGQAGDVASLADVQAVWDVAAANFGPVDIWINNAGIAHPMLPVWELPPAQVQQVVAINLMGALNGARVAIQGMLRQGHGHLYNMEGFGSDGRVRAGLTVYGATKAAKRFLTQSLTAETKGTPVKVSALSPGIVITDLITDQYAADPAGLERAKGVFNILGERVETVAPWLAGQVLANDRSGARLAWLTPAKVTWRFLTARFNRRDLFT